MSEIKPSLEETIGAIIDARLARLNLPRIGRVTEYDSATQKVSVRPVVKEAYRTEEGARATESLPVISDVPVMMFGSYGNHVTHPIAAGTYGLIVFLGVSVDRWLANGTDDADPEDDRSGALSDAVFIPGVRPFSGALAAGDVSDTYTMIGANGGTHQPAALGDNVEALRQAFLGHFHNSPSTGGPTSKPVTGVAGYDTGESVQYPNPASPDPGHVHNTNSIVHELCEPYLTGAASGGSDPRSSTVKITE